MEYENSDNIKILLFGQFLFVGLLRLSRLMKGIAKDFTLSIGYLIGGIMIVISSIGEDPILLGSIFGGILLIVGSVFMICAIRDIRKAKKAKETDELQSYNGI